MTAFYDSANKAFIWVEPMTPSKPGAPWSFLLMGSIFRGMPLSESSLGPFHSLRISLVAQYRPPKVGFWERPFISCGREIPLKKKVFI